MGADAIFQHGLAVFGDGNVELRRERRRLGVLVGGSKHFPIATNGLVHFDDDGPIFVIANGDFEFHFPDVAGNAFVIGLLVFGDHVEGVSDVNVDGLVLRRVVNAVFTGEENAAL